ncbi:hypothetical protein [Undibacterium squillarum]|uniref:hypothetical protein n=1 Tax=Undibacterium squillarum TaxID=1131567 RepID=UPI0035B21445
MIDSNSVAALQDFLESKGTSLRPYGSAEFALQRKDAILFLDLIEKVNGQPLGIEVWKRVANGLSIDALGGWYSDSASHADNLASASEFVCGPLVSDDDLFTIQFD